MLAEGMFTKRCEGALGCWSAGEEGRAVGKMPVAAAGKLELRGVQLRIDVLFYDLDQIVFQYSKSV